MSPGPPFPKLPPVPPSPIKPLREIVRQSRQQVEKARDDIHSLASELRSAASLKAPETQKEAPSGGKTTVTTQKPEKALHSAATEVITRQGLDPETMKWQLGLARADLWDLEVHLKNKCLDCGKDVDCCWKHGQNLIDNHTETASMTTDPMWHEIVEFAKEVKAKAHPEHIKRGTYFNEFPQLVLRASELRRKVDSKLIDLEKPKPPLEEVKKAASEEAAKRAEEAYLKEA